MRCASLPYWPEPQQKMIEMNRSVKSRGGEQVTATGKTARPIPADKEDTCREAVENAAKYGRRHPAKEAPGPKERPINDGKEDLLEIPPFLRRQVS